MAYMGSGGGGYGIFTWSLFFNWGSMPQRVRKTLNSRVQPYPSPTMAGGLLAAERNYFFEIGGYDDDMEGILHNIVNPKKLLNKTLDQLVTLHNKQKLQLSLY